MKKYCLDLRVNAVVRLNDKHVLIKVTHPQPLPRFMPGQFVELRIDDTPSVLLRRPISVNYFDSKSNELWLLVQIVGDGTARLAALREGDVLNAVLPLGNGFTLPGSSGEHTLLVGGGVGCAPLLYLGEQLKERGCDVTYLIGARTQADLLQQEDFAKQGRLCVTTEDGSCGEKGFVTQHTILTEESFDRIYTCGPKPMMMAVARYATSKQLWCEVSLENRMACGIGACLCCVENTRSGHRCVCTEGPVFNLEELQWQS